MFNRINMLGPVTEFCENSTHHPITSQFSRDNHIFMDFEKFGNDMEKQSTTRTQQLEMT